MFARAKIASVLEYLRTSYWFLPSVMAAAAAGLSFLTLYLDRHESVKWVSDLPWLYTGTPEGARQLLAAIGSSMIGLAGVAFSIVIVALTLASNQFGPRLLRNFMRDRGNQVVLGTFISAFVFCILILRQVHGSNGEGLNAFVPQISIVVAVALAIAGVGVLIYFIHHAAASIQAPNVITAVSEDLRERIDKLYPEKFGDEPASENAPPPRLPERFEEGLREVCTDEAGYVVRVEPEELMRLAARHDLIVRIERRPGQFVRTGDAVLAAWPATRVTKDTLKDLREAFVIGSQRSPTQDVEFAVDQLVEVAVRALSPGINDPFTAMQCLDQLGEEVGRLAGRRIPSPYRRDERGELRVIAYPYDFAQVVDAAFNQIRQYASNSLGVLLRLLEVLEWIARQTTDDERRDVLRQHAAMARDLAAGATRGVRDEQAVAGRVARFEAAVRRALPEPAAANNGDRVAGG